MCSAVVHGSKEENSWRELFSKCVILVGEQIWLVVKLTGSLSGREWGSTSLLLMGGEVNETQQGAGLN